MRSATTVSSCLAFFAVVAMSASGCGSGKSSSKRFPVEGTVTIGGEPAARTAVKFHQIDSDNYSFLRTDSQGKFSLPIQDGKGGLAGGEYSVTFSQTIRNGKPIVLSKKETELPDGAFEAVPEDYLDAAKTPIRVEISKNSNTFAFEIKK